MKKMFLFGVWLFFTLILRAVFLEMAMDVPGYGLEQKNKKLVTNVFFETDIREALRDISAQCGVSIIADDTVQGAVTLELNETPLEECLKKVLAGGGYTYKKIDDYYLVGSAVYNNPTFTRLSETKYIKLNYIKAKDVLKFLPKFFADYINVNEEVNVLTITASKEMLSRIEGDLSKIDIPPKQVMIQAMVTDFTKGTRKELGLDSLWEWNNTNVPGSVASGSAEMKDVLGNFTYATTGELTRKLTMKLNALITKGEVSVRANPRIVTQDGQKASIFIGKDQYFSIVSGPVNFPYTTLEAITSGITLTITPYISDNEEITIEIEPEVSDVNEGSKEGLPTIIKRKITTKVRVNNGETIIIGGLTNQNEFEKVVRVPILGYIPIVNFFFMNKKKFVEEVEVVVFITPTILTSGKIK